MTGILRRIFTEWFGQCAKLQKKATYFEDMAKRIVALVLLVLRLYHPSTEASTVLMSNLHHTYISYFSVSWTCFLMSIYPSHIFLMKM